MSETSRVQPLPDVWLSLRYYAQRLNLERSKSPAPAFKYSRYLSLYYFVLRLQTSNSCLSSTWSIPTFSLLSRRVRRAAQVSRATIGHHLVLTVWMHWQLQRSKVHLVPRITLAVHRGPLSHLPVFSTNSHDLTAALTHRYHWEHHSSFRMSHKQISGDSEKMNTKTTRMYRGTQNVVSWKISLETCATSTRFLPRNVTRY